MRFIGSKAKLLRDIDAAILENTSGGERVFCDIFSGSGAVARYFKPRYEIIANDMLYFSYVLQKATIENNAIPDFNKLHKTGIADPLSYLENTQIPPADLSDPQNFISLNFAPHEGCKRMYLSISNAARIDYIRNALEEWRLRGLTDENEYYYLLASLIEGVPFISNITGTYGAYLKTWDKRAYKNFEMVRLNVCDNGFRNRSCNRDANELVRELEGDIMYIDPPYNARQYIPNYHLLETLSRNDHPQLKGVTGMRPYDDERSRFCVKKEALSALEDLIDSARFSHVLLSYSSEGLISPEQIEMVMKKCGVADSFRFYKIGYRKYKSKIHFEEKKLEEYLFYVRKETHLLRATSPRRRSSPGQIGLFAEETQPEQLERAAHLAIAGAQRNCKYIKSPMNYIGGKYKLLPQLTPLFPRDTDTFVDLFTGGCNVAVNAPARKLLCNDINSKIIDLLKSLKQKGIQEILAQIETRIKEFGLTKENEAGFLAFRKYYNQTLDPVDLYTLTCYSFNYQFRFNNSLEYNNPFGRRRSQFSERMRSHLISFVERLHELDVTFSCKNFTDVAIDSLSSKDLIYCDPPYLITTGSYNDGNRGFHDWGVQEELALYEYLDKAHSRGIKFVLSNVLSHKGRQNEILLKWAKQYRIIDVDSNYSNSSYNTSRGQSREVVVMNY